MAAAMRKCKAVMFDLVSAQLRMNHHKWSAADSS
jgi:hypothetical protein